MRLRDWFADHFRFVQYAVPRVPAKREPSRWGWFAVEFTRTAAQFALAAVLFLVYLVKALTPARGRLPVALLFLAALLAATSGMVFCFLI